MWERITAFLVSMFILLALNNCQPLPSSNHLHLNDTASGVIITADFDHSGIIDNCASCHDGIMAEEKPTDHIPTDAPCETCHSVDTWDIQVEDFNHAAVEGTPCIDCHNNQTEAGKPDDHPATPDTCELCHNTDDWDEVASASEDDDHDEEEMEEDFDHATVEGTPCIDCHNNQIEEGKPDNHPATPDTCELCHNTDDWDEINTAAQP